jgi:chromosomal replication initiation ATPase DnaA
MYLAVQLTGEPLQVIARLFEHDRTTVRHAAHVIHRLRRRNSFMEEHDTKCGDAIDQIIAKLRGAA